MGKGGLFEGTLYIERLGSGGYADAKNQFREGGNVSKLQITPNSETKEQEDHRKGKKGQIADSYTFVKPTTLSMTFLDADANNFALSLQAETEAVDQAIATDSTANVTATLDKFVPIASGKYGFTDVSVVNASAEALTKDVDYELQPELGLIKFFSDSENVAADEICVVTYSLPKRAATKIKGALDSNIRLNLVLDGRNVNTGESVVLYIWEATVKPTSGVDFLGSEFLTLELEGQMVTPNGKGSPFEIVVLEEAA